MYVTQPTWLNGPSRSTIAEYGGEVLRLKLPPALVRRQTFGRVQGMGALPQLSQEHCDSYWSLLNPVAWAGGCVARDAANIYEHVQYGHIPRPGELPQAPIVGLPPAGTSLPATVPSGSPAITAADFAEWNRARSAAIAAAEADGSYNPAGNLPFNAIDFSKFWSDYGTYVIVGGLGLAGLVAWKAMAR